MQTQLVANIAQGYFNLLMLDKQFEIAKTNFALSDTFLLATQLLVRCRSGKLFGCTAGCITKTINCVINSTTGTKYCLPGKCFAGISRAIPAAISRSALLKDFIVPDNLSAGLPVSMVSRRPDVRSNEMALMAANAQVGVAQANMYPALNITAGGGLESFKASNWFNIPDSLFGIAAGAIAQPIFKRRN